MVKRKRRSKTADALFPIAAGFKKIFDEQLREIVSGADEVERYVSKYLGKEAATNLKALIPEHRPFAALEALQRRIDGATADEVTALLAIKVRDQRLVFEKAAKTSSAIKAERRRGGIASGAARRTLWAPWREWICKEAKVSTPDKAHPHFKNLIVEVIRFRSGAAGIPKPPGDTRIPTDLPILRGRNGKPPSEDAIRRNLFKSRAK